MKPSPASEPARRRPDRSRRAILQAATKLFAQYGLRRSTMEQISREAGVAKATLYAHFPDKDQVFSAVVEHVIDGLEATAAEAARRAPSPVEAVRALLLEKFAAEWSLINESTHAQELLAASEGLARAQIEAGRARFVRALGRLLRAAGVPKAQSGPLADALYFAFDGLVRGSGSARVFDKRARLLLDRVLPGGV